MLVNYLRTPFLIQNFNFLIYLLFSHYYSGYCSLPYFVALNPEGILTRPPDLDLSANRQSRVRKPPWGICSGLGLFVVMLLPLRRQKLQQATLQGSDFFFVRWQVSALLAAETWMTPPSKILKKISYLR